MQRVFPQDLDSGIPPAAAEVAAPVIAAPEGNFNNLNNNNNNHASEDTTSAGGSSSYTSSTASFNIPAASSNNSRGGRNRNNSNNHNGQSSSSSSSSTRELNFVIHFNSAKHRLKMGNQSTINDLKAKIAEKTGVAACRQALGGWPMHSKALAQNGNSTLRSLDLARETDLNLTDLSAEGFMMPAAHEVDVVGRLNAEFTLNILLEPEGRVLPMKMRGVSTYLDVKNNVNAVTRIAPRHQAWTGWPRNITDSTTLAQSGIELEHNFTLRSSFTIELDNDDDEDNDRELIEDDDDDDDVVLDDDDDDFNMGGFGTRRTRSRGGLRVLDSSMPIEVDDSEDDIENASHDDPLEAISRMHRPTTLSKWNFIDVSLGPRGETREYYAV